MTRLSRVARDSSIPVSRFQNRALSSSLRSSTQLSNIRRRRPDVVSQTDTRIDTCRLPASDGLQKGKGRLDAILHFDLAVLYFPFRQIVK